MRTGRPRRRGASASAAPGRAGAREATAHTDSRSRYRSAASASASRAASRSGCSAAQTRPRWRLGSGCPSSRGIAPSTGTPVSAASARRITSSCRAVPTRFRTTPASGSWVEGAAPEHQGAAVRVSLAAFTTSTTGAPMSLASCAVECVPRASAPSKRPRLPSTSARSAVRAARCIEPAMVAGDMSQVSRLRPGARAAAPSQAASMKSGPFLKGATRCPRRVRARARPSATRLLPVSPARPATTILGMPGRATAPPTPCPGSRRGTRPRTSCSRRRCRA
jgi:hypothetical protein